MKVVRPTKIVRTTASSDAGLPSCFTPRLGGGVFERGPLEARSGGFRSFVFDARNELAYRAVLDTARRPGYLSRLLFLYGVPGSGKTHLLQAAEELLCDRHLSVRLLRAGYLTMLFSTAIQARTVPALERELLEHDVLLIDEVHRLGQLRATRAFLDRMASAFLESGRTLVFASRHHPRAIYGLEERQVSLFMSGFVVELESPGLHAREVWLRDVHRQLTGLMPPPEIHRLVRGIHGGLGVLLAAHRRLLLGASVEEIIGQTSCDLPRAVEVTGEVFGVDVGLLRSRSNSRSLREARDALCCVALRLGYRPSVVGHHLAGRRAPAVRVAAKRVEERLRADTGLASRVEEILRRLTG